MNQAAPQDEADVVHPTDLLISVIATLLAPLFLGSGCTDISLARAAAFETIACYRARNQADLLVIAQIIAFGFAALGAASMALTEDVPASTLDRLLKTAVSLNRAGDRLEKSRNRIDTDSRAQATATADQTRAVDDQMAEAKALAAVEHARKLAEQTVPAQPMQPAATPPTQPAESGATAQPVPAAKQPAQPAAKQPEQPAAAEPPQRASIPSTQPGAKQPAPPGAKQPAPPGAKPAESEAAHKHRMNLGAMFASIAEQFAAEMPGLPPDERRAHANRAGLAADIARDLFEGLPYSVVSGLEAAPTPRNPHQGGAAKAGSPKR